MKHLFEIKNISKVYGDDEAIQVHALNDVTVNIEKGEFTALIGPSGSGKSTLLNIMSGIDHPTKGEVVLAGQQLTEMTETEMSDFRRDHIGFVFQSYNLIPVLTVGENIEYIMLLQGRSKKERKERVAEVLSEVGLEGFENKLPAKLSGGQQQRVAVARAVAARPDIVLADEPTANLDSASGKALLDMMEDLNQKDNITFVFSTHDSMIMERARRIIKLQDGRIV